MLIPFFSLFYGPGISLVATGGMAMFGVDENYMDEMAVIKDEVIGAGEMECLA